MNTWLQTFASFSLLSFNSVSSQLPHFEFLNILRHYSVTFFANWVGGGVLMGLAYAWLNNNQESLQRLKNIKKSLQKVLRYSLYVINYSTV